MSYTIQGKTHEWEVVCGLEIHCQVISKSKLFSGAPVAFGNEANSNVSPIDAGMPGMLPVINTECVKQAILTGLGINAKINHHSEFSRKSYFYPDLPMGYQISQFDKPIVGNGHLEIDLKDGSSKTIRIERIHLETDAGKSNHNQHPKYSMIDLNRAGTALMELVTYPDLTTPEEVTQFVAGIRSIVRYLGTCDGNMDEGSMRCDVNVSVRPVGSTELRTRTEIKNVNSLRFIAQAFEYEVLRQVELYEAGKGDEIVQETRLFDESTGVTKSMRSKEDALDYRYMPDPDLLPLHVTDAEIEAIRQTMPELPNDKKKRFISEYNLSPYDANVITAEKENAAYFEEALKYGKNPKNTVNWIITNLFAVLKDMNLPVTKSPISAMNLGKLVALIEDNIISGRIAKDVFEIMIKGDQDPEQIIEEKGLKQITDTGAIEKIVDDIIANNPDNVNAYKGGQHKLMGWFVGQVMKASQGKANPQAVNKILKDKLA